VDLVGRLPAAEFNRCGDSEQPIFTQLLSIFNQQ
jgi:hypothetical protein